jgi:hypothetical protein
MAENLFCPRCGKQFGNQTSFCRTCGLSLAPVVEVVNGDVENKPVVTRRPNFKLFQIGIALFIFGMVIGLINGALKDFELFPQSYGKLVFLLFIAAGLLTLGAGFLFPTKKYTKHKPSSQSTVPVDADTSLDTAPFPHSLNEARTNVNDFEFPKDDREFDKFPVASVTDHTTRNLE